MSGPFVSIIVPVLNDTDALEALLARMPPNPDVEIIVINAAPPDDRLAAMTTRPDIQLLTSPAGRGRQMNVGALAARGRWFVFLHADTRLPTEWLGEIRRADANAAIIGGSFQFRLDSGAWQARILEGAVRWRVRSFDLAYGDQALFVRRDAFHAIGGYREWPLMEDVALVRSLRQLGKLYHSPRPAVTSARRWEHDGWGRRSATNVALQLLFFAGVSPERLAGWYSRSGRRATREALVIMARAPSDARGKSRLTRDLTGDHVELRRAILLDTLDAVRDARNADLFVAFEPAEAASEIQSLVGSVTGAFPQRGETLGERMRHAFATLFARGYSSIVMIGSDLPTLPASHVRQAFDRLHDRPDVLVIGPAVDGGYYLVGLRRLYSELFATIPWSTPDVLASTTSVAEDLGLSVSHVPAWYDVDAVDDLRRVMREERVAQRTRLWVTAHTEVDHLLLRD
ncbi:MAG TPA: TIGR04283 family arsenosugar biosynthesis glycosyltransferase [Vicinamibacterales bacterium]|nr:TIGR04283 family arsenosugar biosynthesis glycosyltransferase [Vicinamibacterales bacterium]